MKFKNLIFGVGLLVVMLGFAGKAHAMVTYQDDAKSKFLKGYWLAVNEQATIEVYGERKQGCSPLSKVYDKEGNEMSLERMDMEFGKLDDLIIKERDRLRIPRNYNFQEGVSYKYLKEKEGNLTRLLIYRNMTFKHAVIKYACDAAKEIGISIPRYAKRSIAILHYFLDNNWGSFGPVFGKMEFNREGEDDEAGVICPYHKFMIPSTNDLMNSHGLSDGFKPFVPQIINSDN